MAKNNENGESVPLYNKARGISLILLLIFIFSLFRLVDYHDVTGSITLATEVNLISAIAGGVMLSGLAAIYLRLRERKF